MFSNKKVVVFDFDGTLTRKDTLFEFIKYSCGTLSLLWGILLCSPIVIATLIGLYPRGKAKERLFSHFFKGCDYGRFAMLGKQFVEVVRKMERKDIVSVLENHIESKDIVYIISASIEEWILPWSNSIGKIKVLSTKIEIDHNGFLTGRFLTKNCSGYEKINRLLKVEPDRDNYLLYAYGNGRGDKEMIDFADYGCWV